MIAKAINGLLLVAVSIAIGDPCFPDKRDVSCRLHAMDDSALSAIPKNCTVLMGDLVIELAPVLPRKIDVLSNIRTIQGSLVIVRTEYSGDFKFLNNVRCIYNAKGPAILLRENLALNTLGLINIQKLYGDPVISSIGDSYLINVDESELRRLIKVSSIDGTYREEMIKVDETPDDYESTYFFISFAVFSLLVALIIIVGHFVLKIHVPKGDGSSRLIASSKPSSGKSSQQTEPSPQPKSRTRVSWTRNKPSRRRQQDKL